MSKSLGNGTDPRTVINGGKDLKVACVSVCLCVFVCLCVHTCGLLARAILGALTLCTALDRASVALSLLFCVAVSCAPLHWLGQKEPAYGADVLRMWAASTAYHNGQSCSRALSHNTTNAHPPPPLSSQSPTNSTEVYIKPNTRIR